MPGALAVTLPLIIAAVLVSSAIAKLRNPDDVSGWAEMGVPRVFRRRWLVALHPWAEAALGVALALLGGLLGLMAGMASVVLMGAYLLLVIRVRRTAEGATCACFGARRPVTAVTIARNAWLLIVAVACVAVIWTNPLWGGALAAGFSVASWVMATAIAAVTTAVILWPDSKGSAESAGAPALSAGNPDAEELDYIRVRTPSVPVILGDGSTANLRELAARKPILLLAVSEMCGSCTPVIESVPKWRSLLPEVDVRFLLALPPEVSRLTEATEPQSLHDTQDYVRGSIEDWPTPTALLLGADGLLAGGPVSGDRAVAQFIHDIHESLHPESSPPGSV